uniref:P-type domain-containing protein n=1 Tax=Ciona savignyi TaxID=51511 RepID=H2YQU7_CIOSA
MYIPGFILILAVSVFGQLQDIPVEKCKCWVPTYNRVACNQYNPNIPQGQCESMGCCYHDSGLYTTPKCYRMTGRCPPQQCLIPASQRTVCITANLASTRCLNGQCCYDGGSAPHCYQSIGRQPVPRYDTSVRRSMFSDGGGENIPHMPKGYLRQGNAMLIVGGCERATMPCGTTKTTKEQCMRFMCCWMPSRKTPSGQTCFTSIYNFIKFPFAKWNNWGNWEACSTTTPCVTGTQNRRRTCENQKVNGPGCQGSDVESRSCTTCTVSWGAWTAYGACVSSETLCASGTQTRTRQCQNSAAVVQPSSSCTGVDTENQVCNANLCPTYTPWSGACSVTCGGGTQNRARTCTTTPAGPIPASCTAETGVACNTQSCNKDLDIMFIVDSSDQLDLCSTKESALSIIAPFASTN